MSHARSMLREYGLSEKEVEIYLACLALGRSTVYALSQHTRIPKSTCYDLLASLQSRGLVASVHEGRVKQFEAIDPKRLLVSLDEQRDRIASVLPKLEQIKGSISRKPIVTLHEGVAGVKTVWEKMIPGGNEVLVIGDFFRSRDRFPFIADMFVERRLERGMSCRLLEAPIPEHFEIAKGDRSANRQTRYFRDKKQLNAECFIHDDSVAFFSLAAEHPLAILIENHEIADLMRRMFDETWDARQ